MIEFYPAKIGDNLNGKPYHPEAITGTAMLNPIYPVANVKPCRVIMDSGAFQDMATRLTPSGALDRQLRYARRLQDSTPIDLEYLVIYDQMAGVDEQLINGKAVKVRGTEDTAKRAVAQTLESARLYAHHRERIADVGAGIAFAGQGITPDQYVLECVKPMMEFMQPSDCFAFGGFCILGRMPKRLMPTFQETVTRVVDMLSAVGITRFHLLGICYPPAIRFASDLAAARNVVFSTDSSAVEQSSVKSGVCYVDGHQRKTHDVGDKYKTWHPNALAHANIQAYQDWVSAL